MPAGRDSDGMTSSIVVAIADPAESRATLDLGIRAARLLQLPLVIGAVGESMEVVTTDQIGGWVGPLVDAKTVELSMRKSGGAAVTFVLNTGVPPRDTTIGGYDVALHALAPRPNSHHVIEPDEYVASVSVGR